MMDIRSWARQLSTQQVLAYGALLIIGLALLGANLAAIFVPRAYVFETRVVVGTRELTAQQVPYYSTAAVSMAETYARYVTEADGAEVSPEVSITASVIADSPVIRVQASAPVEEDARTAVEQATENLITEANEGVPARSADLSAEIADRTRELAELTLQSEELEEVEDPDRDELVRVQTEVRLTELRLSALSEAYLEAQTASLNPATQLSAMEPAYQVTETVPRPVLVGGVAGAMLGAFAVFGWFTLRARRPSTT